MRRPGSTPEALASALLRANAERERGGGVDSETLALRPDTLGVWSLPRTPSGLAQRARGRPANSPPTLPLWGVAVCMDNVGTRILDTRPKLLRVRLSILSMTLRSKRCPKEVNPGVESARDWRDRRWPAP